MWTRSDRPHRTPPIANGGRTGERPAWYTSVSPCAPGPPNHRRTFSGELAGVPCAGGEHRAHLRPVPRRPDRDPAANPSRVGVQALVRVAAARERSGPRSHGCSYRPPASVRLVRLDGEQADGVYACTTSATIGLMHMVNHAEQAVEHEGRPAGG